MELPFSGRMSAARVLDRQRRILIVDDYDDQRHSVAEALQDLGYSVVEAENGQRALHFLVSNAPGAVDLIVLDLQMPVMSGWQFLQLLGSYINLRRIPVLVVSAHSPNLYEATHHSAVVGALHVPYRMDELLKLVGTSLSH
jgi:CheY-like chemotaxis protein